MIVKTGKMQTATLPPSGGKVDDKWVKSTSGTHWEVIWDLIEENKIHT